MVSDPGNSTDEETAEFLVDVADNALREALAKAAPTAAPEVLVHITEGIIAVTEAKEHFEALDDDDD